MVSRPKGWEIIFYYAPPILWMGVIFYLSTSQFSAEATSRFLLPFLKLLFPQVAIEVLGIIHATIRKAGHFLEYALLSYLWYRAMDMGRGRWSPRVALLAFGLSVLYAVFDELHQSFVPNRTGASMDVAIDTAGAGLMQAFIGLVQRVTNPRGP